MDIEAIFEEIKIAKRAVDEIHQMCENDSAKMFKLGVLTEQIDTAVHQIELYISEGQSRKISEN